MRFAPWVSLSGSPVFGCFSLSVSLTPPPPAPLPAARRCRYNERFLAKMIMTPLIVFLGVPLSVPVWNKMRGLKKLQFAFEKLKLPTHIHPHHHRRGLLNAYLFVFAPLTRDAVQTLVCVETCGDINDPSCEKVLAFDMSVVCFKGAHWNTALIALIELALLVVIIPLLMIAKVNSARQARSASLSMKASEAETWCVGLQS